MANKSLREIKDQGKTIALFCSKKHTPGQGLSFITPLDYPLQIGRHEYKNNPRAVPPHLHPHLKYKVDTTQEMLYVERGVMEVAIYNKKWKKIAKLRLTTGDFVLFADCGHDAKFHKGAKVLEIKQGPYPGDKKAKIFRD